MRDIIILYSAKTTADLATGTYLPKPRHELGLKVIYTLTDKTDTNTGPHYRHGRVDVKLIKQEVPDYSDGPIIFRNAEYGEIGALILSVSWNQKTIIVDYFLAIISWLIKFLKKSSDYFINRCIFGWRRLSCLAGIIAGLDFFATATITCLTPSLSDAELFFNGYSRAKYRLFNSSATQVVGYFLTRLPSSLPYGNYQNISRCFSAATLDQSSVNWSNKRVRPMIRQHLDIVRLV